MFRTKDLPGWANPVLYIPGGKGALQKGGHIFMDREKYVVTNVGTRDNGNSSKEICYDIKKVGE